MERRDAAAVPEDIYVYLSAGSNVPATHPECVCPPSSTSTVINSSKYENLQPLQKAKTSLLQLLASVLTDPRDPA